MKDNEYLVADWSVVLKLTLAAGLICGLSACGVKSGDAPADVSGRPGLSYPGESYEQEGLASWYGRELHGRRTASGEKFNMRDLTAAHRSLPFDSRALVRNLDNGREVVVRINDRGPFHRERIIDLSRAAAREIGLEGVGRVSVKTISEAEARARTGPEGRP